MSGWQGKSKANTTGYKIFVFLLKNFGLNAAYFLLYFVAFYYFLFASASSKHIFYFYNKILKFGKIRTLGLLYKNYFKLGQTLIDKTAMIAKIKTNFTYTFEGRNFLEELVEGGKGGLLLSAHVGNWEAAGQMLDHLNTHINIVMYDGEDANIKKYMDSVTGKRTFKIIYVKEDLSHIFQIKNVLAANELVCIHADRFLPGNKTILSNFYNQPVKFPYGPFLLALKMNAPAVFVFAFKESNKHYHFFSSRPVDYTKSKGDTEHTILKAFIKDLESKVAQYPTQWFNYHDFFIK